MRVRRERGGKSLSAGSDSRWRWSKRAVKASIQQRCACCHQSVVVGVNGMRPRHGEPQQVAKGGAGRGNVPHRCTQQGRGAAQRRCRCGAIAPVQHQVTTRLPRRVTGRGTQPRTQSHRPQSVTMPAAQGHEGIAAGAVRVRQPAGGPPQRQLPVLAPTAAREGTLLGARRQGVGAWHQGAGRGGGGGAGGGGSPLAEPGPPPPPPPPPPRPPLTWSARCVARARVRGHGSGRRRGCDARHGGKRRSG
jgi:hypothetical protein